MKNLSAVAAAIVAGMLLCAGTASAQCVTKGANATAGSEASAKWFVMETMVQAVSWGLWPGWVANGKIAGYSVRSEKYECKPQGGQVFCRGRATFCKTG